MSITKGLRERVLEAVANHWKKNGYAPTFSDIMKRSGAMSTSTVTYWVRKLEGEGLISYVRGVARTLQMTEAGWRAANGTSCCPCGRAPCPCYKAGQQSAFREKADWKGGKIQ